MANGCAGAANPPCMLLGRRLVWPWCTGAAGRRQAVRLRPELPRAGRLQTGPAPRSSRMKPQAPWPETNICRGGVCKVPHTHGALRSCLRGHWLVHVAPPVVSASPVHDSGRCAHDADLDPGLIRPETLTCPPPAPTPNPWPVDVPKKGLHSACRRGHLGRQAALAMQALGCARPHAPPGV